MILALASALFPPIVYMARWANAEEGEGDEEEDESDDDDEAVGGGT